MMSATAICNMALSHLGISKEIASITEATSEARACNRFYDNTIEIVLSDSAWPFATRFADLELVEEDPTTEWAYSYRYPAACLNIRRILSGARQDTQGTRQPMKIASDATGKLIYTDLEDATVEYTVALTSSDLFPADFAEAMSYRLAFSIAPRVTGGDPFKLGDRALEGYRTMMAVSRAKAANEEQPDVPVESEFIRERK